MARAGMPVTEWRRITPTLEDVFIDRLAQAPALQAAAAAPPDAIHPENKL